jgi:DNA-binding NarL/FixJ family response regulator
VRIVVVSDRHLSRIALTDALKHIPNAVLVTEVQHLRAARSYCRQGKADVVVADAIVLADEADAGGTILGELHIDEFASKAAAELPPTLAWRQEGKLRHIANSQIYQLSMRERQVFVLLGTGLSNRRISLQLGISERTVKSHVCRILAKLELESRLEAGLAALMHYAARPATDDVA